MSTTPEKSPRASGRSVSVATFMEWARPTLEKKFKLFFPNDDVPTNTKNLQTAVLQGLCQRKLLRDSAMAYDTVPEGVPPTPAQIPKDASEQSSLKSTVDNLTNELSTFREFVATVTQSQLDSLMAQVTALKEELQELKSSELRQRDEAETRERTARRNRLCFTRLPELPDTQSDVDLLETVNQVLSSIGCKAKAISAQRVGRKPGSYADKVERTSVRTRPIIVTMQTWDDKIEVLRRKKNLANTSYSKIGVEEDLTPKQASEKQACWDTYVQARKEGKKAYWRAHQLFIEGVPQTPTLKDNK